MRLALEDEENKNSKLKKELDLLTDKNNSLVSTIQRLEEQVEAARTSQRNFNLAERTQRIQTHYADLRGSMVNYYNQISGALPLLMLLSNGNSRLGDVIPLLAGTLGEFNNGEDVDINYQAICSVDSAKRRWSAKRAFRRSVREHRN